MSERTTSAAWVKGVADALSGAGLDARALCAEAGIDIDALGTSELRCASEKLSLLWQLAAARANDPAIALATPQASQPQNFEVVGYAMMSSDNLQVVADHHAQPFIAFKANSVSRKEWHSDIWNRAFHFYSFNQKRFMECYHKRSNVETTFSMIKSKFGDRLHKQAAAWSLAWAGQ